MGCPQILAVAPYNGLLFETLFPYTFTPVLNEEMDKISKMF